MYAMSTIKPQHIVELGYNSKAVHRAYAKHAEVTVPSLADWEKDWQKNAQRATHEKFTRGAMACFRASQQ
jgi:hypothetical protein